MARGGWTPPLQLTRIIKCHDSLVTTGKVDWPHPPTELDFSPGIVHVWSVRLNVHTGSLDQLSNLLSDDERIRAERFHFSRHQNRYTVCRGRLRQILARYLGLGPEHVRFEYGAHGKPFLADAQSRSGIRFNVSKSHELALVAVAILRDVGVDVERIRPVSDAEQIAQRYFSAEEQRDLESLPASQRNLAFLHLWTRKEALLKAIGTGLSMELDQLTVTADPLGPVSVVALDGCENAKTQWQIAPIIPSEQYVGALASPGDPHETVCWTCPH